MREQSLAFTVFIAGIFFAAGLLVLQDIPREGMLASTVLATSNKQCPPPSKSARYEKGKPWNRPFPEYSPELKQFVPIINLYGKPCYESTAEVFVKGICVGTALCKAQEYLGQDGKLHKVEDGDPPPGKNVEVASLKKDGGVIDGGGGDGVLEGGAGNDTFSPGDNPVTSDTTKTESSAPTSNTGGTTPSSGKTSTSGGTAPSTGGTSPSGGSKSTAAPTNSGVSAPSVSPAPPPPSAWQGIQTIAATPPPPPSYGSNYNTGGNSGGSGPSFTFNFPSESTGGNFVYLGGSQPQPISSGPIALAPKTTSIGGNYNTTFEKTPSVNFPQGSSYEEIAQLAERQIAEENAQFERAVEKILKEKFPEQASGRSVSAGDLSDVTTSPLTRFTEGVAEGVRDVFAGVSEFFTSVFNIGEASPGIAGEGEEKAGTLVVEPDENSLAAGDPTFVFTEIPETSLEPAPDPFRGAEGLAEALPNAGPRPPIAQIDRIARAPEIEGEGAPQPPLGVAPTSKAQGSVSPVEHEEGAGESGGLIETIVNAVEEVVAAISEAIKNGITAVLSWF